MLSVRQCRVRGLKKLCTGKIFSILFYVQILLIFIYLIRTTRWLDRCLKAHKRPENQNLFPIVQGGLDPRLRTESARQLMERDVAGFAIGGLR